MCGAGILYPLICHFGDYTVKYPRRQDGKGLDPDVGEMDYLSLIHTEQNSRLAAKISKDMVVTVQVTSENSQSALSPRFNSRFHIPKGACRNLMAVTVSETVSHEERTQGKTIQ